MAYNTNRTASEKEIAAQNKLSDVIRVSEANLSQITDSFGGILDVDVASDLAKSLTFVSGASQNSTQSPFFDTIFEQGLGNFFENYKDLGVILNAYRSTYIPEEIAKNIAKDVSQINKTQADLATRNIKNETVEEIQEISSKKFLKESYENCFMRLMGLPSSDNLKNISVYMDYSTGEMSSVGGSDMVPQKVIKMLDERQGLNYKVGKTLDNTFYDVSQIQISDIDPFAGLDPSVSNILSMAQNEAMKMIQNEAGGLNTISSDDAFSFYTRALAVVSNTEFDAGRQSFLIDPLYIEGIKGEGSFRSIFDFLFYGKFKGLPILNVADEIKSYSYLMFPTVQDSRIGRCIAERGKYISPPFEHQTGFRVNNDKPVMSFLEGIIRIRLDKLSGYDPENVIAISKNSNISKEYSFNDVDGSYSILESIMVNRLLATLSICAKRLSESCKSYVKNAIKSNITITTKPNPNPGVLSQGSKAGSNDPEASASSKSIGKNNSAIAIEEQSLKILKGIEDSMVLLLGDTSKGLDVQNGTLRKSTITETPLMNILVSSVTIPSKYIKAKEQAVKDQKRATKDVELETKKREISSIIGIGRGVGILDALVFILAMLTVDESVLISMLTPRQYDNLKKEFGDQKFFESFDLSKMDIEAAVEIFSFQVNEGYNKFVSFLKPPT